MTNIINQSQLQSAMEIATNNALQAITKEVLGIFIDEYIVKLVYQSHGGNVVYHNGTKDPTFQFLEAWDWTPIKKAINTISTELWFNPANMDFDMDTFLHGSKYSSPVDVRDNLPAILEGRKSRLWLSVYRPERFWQKFIEDMFNGGKLESIITKHFVANGFVKI